MVMTVRTRTISYGDELGIYTAVDGTRTTVRRQNGVSTIEDTSGMKHSDNPMSLVRDRYQGGILNGSRNDILRMSWVNVPVAPRPSGTTLVPEISDNAAAIRARNLTNPGREIVSVSQFLVEMREIPLMVKNAFESGAYARDRTTLGRFDTELKPFGSLDLQVLAGSNIAAQFGWMPFMSDIVKMLQFTKAAERRLKELNRLHQGKGLKRRIVLDDREVTQVIPTNIESKPATLLSHNITRSSLVRRWGTLRWRPSEASPRLSQLDDGLIKAMYTGFHPQQAIKTVYELIPWSWFIDWFSNVGDLVALTNNAAGVYPPHQCTMTHERVLWSAPSASWSLPSGGITFSKYESVRETKKRVIGISNYLPEVNLPFLTGGQLSILASLTITRGKGSHILNL